MQWNLIIFFIFMGMGVAATGLIARRLLWNPRGFKAGALALVLMLLFPYLGISLIDEVSDWRGKREMRRYLEKDILFKLIISDNPELRPTIEKAVYKIAKKGPHRGLKGREMYDALIGIATVWPKYAAKSADHLVLGHSHATVRVLRRLSSVSPELCYDLIIPQPGRAVDPRIYLDSEEYQDLRNSVIRVIESAIKEPQSAPSETAGKPLLKKVAAKLYQQHGDDISLFDDPSVAGVDKSKVCSLFISLYDEAMMLPGNEGGVLLRYMFSLE